LKHTSEDRIAPFSNLLQIELFPLLEAAVGTLGKQARLLVSVVSLQPLAHWLVRSPRLGRRPCSRQSLATAFLAKAVYNLPTTRLLIQRLQTDTQLRRLCGWRHSLQHSGIESEDHPFPACVWATRPCYTEPGDDAHSPGASARRSAKTSLRAT
jgi:hypothetical protein